MHMTKKSFRFRGAFAATLGACAALIAGPSLAEYHVQALPQVISYHGQLEHDGQAVNGTRSLTFKLFVDKASCESAASPTWTTTRDVGIYSGQFAVQLGDSSVGDQPIDLSLFRGNETSLAISVDGVALNGCQTLRPTPYSQRSAGDVPIGTVIDWWRADSSVDVPLGYKICDGTEVSDPRSPLNGTAVPNLNGKFIRGVSDPNQIGASGGQDTVSFPDYTGSGTTSTDTYTHNHRWAYFTDNQNWYTYYASGSSGLALKNWGDGLGEDGNGTYPLAEDSTVSSTRHYYTNNDTHSHSHNVTITSQPDTPSQTNMPAYVGLLKLIRIY